MHQSVRQFFLKYSNPEEFRGKRVLDVGSYDVNGSLREFIHPWYPAEYVGTDMRAGPGVDYVIDATRLETVFGQQRFDAVICTEMLEHAEDWKSVVKALKAVMAPGAVLYLTTRSEGFPLHDHPSDHWRFSLYDIHAMFCDLDIDYLRDDPDPNSPGVFLKARMPGDYEPVAYLDSIEPQKPT